ncbi:MAG: apolipoprotein N-acyltransferase [Sulfuricella sp.]|nr:apolipoprotein N-acyltransferase [Sulfuricella sp.]
MKRLSLAPLRPLALPFFLGILTVAGFSPFDIFILPVVTLALLFRVLRQAHGHWTASRSGLVFGLGMFGAGVYWVYVSLHDFGGMPLPVAVVVTALFCTVLALFPALLGALQGRIGGTPTVRYLLVMPALWVALEWTRGWLFTGFPWLALGYSQAPDSPLAGYAALFGVYGVSLLVAVSAGALALLGERPLRKGLALALLAGVWLGGWGLKQVAWTQPVGEPVSVSLLQGNIPQEMKWRPEKTAATLKLYRDLALGSRGRLIVMPETALPLFIDQIPRPYYESLAAHAVELNGDVIMGAPEYDGQHYFNSVLAFGVEPVQLYRKVHLVPFGEFIPLKPFGPWLVHQVLNIPLDDFARGADNQAPLRAAGQKLALAVCYEDVFGEEMIRALPEATMLVNISNDAWFGESVAPWQHLQIARMRALETGRYMLRATNTGVTAILDQRGATVKIAPQAEITRLDGMAQGFSGATPYVRWGNLPVLAALVLMLAAGRWRRR